MPTVWLVGIRLNGSDRKIHDTPLSLIQTPQYSSPLTSLQWFWCLKASCHEFNWKLSLLCTLDVALSYRSHGLGEFAKPCYHICAPQMCSSSGFQRSEEPPHITDRTDNTLRDTQGWVREGAGNSPNGSISNSGGKTLQQSLPKLLGRDFMRLEIELWQHGQTHFVTAASALQLKRWESLWKSS